jgi:citrate lyase subunit beta/citryl-CoA lyase
VRIDALIETAVGLRALDRTATSSDRLRALIVGYADLAADLGRGPGGDPSLWDPGRTSAVAAARASALVAIDGPWLGVAADAAFEVDRQRSRAHGFDGSWVIHPVQVPAATRIFSPSAEQVERAGRVVDALADAVATGQGAVSLDGQMLDEAVAVRARSTLARVRGRMSR